MRRKNCGGFTIIEIFISIAVLIIVAFVMVAVSKEVRMYSYSAVCLNNLRQISLALASYFSDANDYPEGLPEHLLKDQLKKYVTDPQIFICPSDKFERHDSYSRFYVYRGPKIADVGYVLGCPRHRNDKIALNVFSLGSTSSNGIAKVTKDKLNISPGQVISQGTMVLEDGSKITPQNAKVMLVQSFRMDDGTLYSIVKLLDGEEGSVTCDVIPGSRLEIVTPSAIAAVRGTTFIVRLSYDNGVPVTKVGVSAGLVAVYPINNTGEPQSQQNTNETPMLCSAGNEITVTGKKPETTGANTKNIEKYVDDLKNKLAELKGKGVRSDSEDSFCQWVSDYVNKDNKDNKE